MMLINVNTTFKEAIFDENIQVLEDILASSDSRVDLLEEFANKEDITLFTNILPKFRGKGLISNIDEYCNAIKSKVMNEKKIEKESKPRIVKCVNEKNIEINKIKYLQEDTFSKNSATR